MHRRKYVGGKMNENAYILIYFHVTALSRTTDIFHPWINLVFATEV
jgi:hypothetical protein